jgi:hypothetical protein
LFFDFEYCLEPYFYQKNKQTKTEKKTKRQKEKKKAISLVTIN